MKEYLRDVACSATQEPCVCACHKGYIHRCVLPVGHDGEYHEADSIHNTKGQAGPGKHSMKWTVDASMPGW